MSKEVKAEAIKQFSPTSRLNLDGKIFMGVLSNRLVTYL